MPTPSLPVKGLLERVPTHALCYRRKASRSTKHSVNLHFAVAKVGVLIEISASVNNGAQMSRLRSEGHHWAEPS